MFILTGCTLDGLHEVPCEKRLKLNKAAFGGLCPEKFAFAIKVRKLDHVPMHRQEDRVSPSNKSSCCWLHLLQIRMPKPSKDERMTQWRSKDDTAMGPVRKKLPDDLYQFLWDEEIDLEDWDNVTAIVRPDPKSGKGPVHIEYVPHKTSSHWKRAATEGNWAKSYSGTIGTSAGCYA